MLTIYLIGLATTAISLTLCIALNVLSCGGKWGAKCQSILIHAAIWPISAIVLIGEFIKLTSACLFDD